MDPDPYYQQSQGTLPMQRQVPAQQLPPRTNILAIISLVASLSTFFTGFGFIAGIITGHYAVRQIEDRGEEGLGYARAGLIIGYLCLGLVVAFALLVLVGILLAATAPMS